MSFNLISKDTGYNKEVRHETFCMNLPFITTKITGIDNQLLEKQIKDLLRGRLKINKVPYQYIGEFKDLLDIITSFKLNDKKLSKHQKIKQK